jgi:hypothetical protein
MESAKGWIDTEYLLARWQIEPVELADYISHHGLPAYPIDMEQFRNHYEYILDNLEEHRVNPKNTRILNMIRSNCLSFDWSDVVNFEKDHPEIQSLNDWRWSADNLPKPVDYDNWGQMDYWSMSEAVQLVCDQKPDPDIDNYQFTDEDYFRKTKNPVRREMARIYDLVLRGYIINTIEHETSSDRLYPASFIKWAINKNIPVPDKLLRAVRTYHKDEFKKEIIPKADAVIEQPITGQERQELGILRQQKDKWERAVKAAVHATLFSTDKKVTRDELSHELYKFELPDTTLELIWKNLRENGMTKGPGRPKKAQ